ncbi:Retrovirus-related Pol polyprotein from transposon opus, partial [Mucuna pruriens]
MKHPIEDHSLFGIDMIEELVEEYFQLDSYCEDIEDFAKNVDVTSCLGSITEEPDCEEVHNLPNFEDNNDDVVDLDFEAELFEVIDQACNHENLECANDAETDPKSLTENSSSSPLPLDLKPLLKHLKYAYLDTEQQLPVIIANNLRQEQEDKLLNVLRQHKKAIGWKLSDLPGINPSICMHRILMEEEIKPIRQQQRRLNPTILDVVKKEVTKLLVARIIYHISDSQWVSPVQVMPKKSGMTVMKNQHDEQLARITFLCLLLTESWKIYQGNPITTFWMASQDTYKFILYLKINIRLPSPTHLAPLRTPACHLDCVTLRVRSSVKVLKRCINTNLVLNFEKYHFMVTEGIVLGHLVSNRGIEVDKSKIDIITSLPNPNSVREVRSFLGHAGFYRRFIKNFSKLALPLSRLLPKDVDFNLDQPCIEAF